MITYHHPRGSAVGMIWVKGQQVDHPTPHAPGEPPLEPRFRGSGISPPWGSSFGYDAHQVADL